MPVIEVNVGFNEYESTVIGNQIFFARYRPDSYADSPFDMSDSEGKILSFNSRHGNFIGYDKEEEIEELRKDPMTVLLGYYEHGSSMWFVSPQDGGQRPLAQHYSWDGRDYAGLWVATEDAEDNIQTISKDPTHVWYDTDIHKIAIKYAESVCKEYTAWINGDVWMGEVKVFNLLRDEDKNIIREYDHYDDVSDYTGHEVASNIYDMDEAKAQAAAMVLSLVENDTDH